MKNEQMENETAAAEAELENRPEVKEIRHTISKEETFTLAKDVYDLRCLIKQIYSNRAQIARRLNFVGTVCSAIFTLLYAAFLIWGGLNKLAGYASLSVISYVTMGVYGALLIAMIVLAAVAKNTSAKKVKKINRANKILRYVIRVVSLVMAITALVLAIISGESSSKSVALDTVAIIISIIFVIFSLLPLIFGGLGGLARWLISPPKLKHKFSMVILEWYRLLVSDNGATVATRKVSKRYLDDIGRCVDDYINVKIGKKRMQAVSAQDIEDVLSGVPEEDREVVEGIIKNVFAYALECNYVTSDPCKELNLEGSIEVKEKPRKLTFKEKLGQKVKNSIMTTIFGPNEE